MSGDGRAAPTTTGFEPSAAARNAATDAMRLPRPHTDQIIYERMGPALAAAFPVMLAQFVAEWSERGPYHVLTPDEDPNRLNDWTVAREGHYRQLQRPCFATSREAIARHVAAALNYEEARHG